MTGKIVYGKPTRYFLNGTEVPEAAFREAFPDQSLGMFGGHLASCWPMKPSEALAVHPNLRMEAIASAQKKGVPTDFDRAGRPIFRDRAHRKAYCKAYGFYDRTGGYGDQPDNPLKGEPTGY